MTRIALPQREIFTWEREVPKRLFDTGKSKTDALETSKTEIKRWQRRQTGPAWPLPRVNLPTAPLRFRMRRGTLQPCLLLKHRSAPVPGADLTNTIHPPGATFKSLRPPGTVSPASCSPFPPPPFLTLSYPLPNHSPLSPVPLFLRSLTSPEGVAYPPPAPPGGWGGGDS